MNSFTKMLALCTAALCSLPLHTTVAFQANAAEVSQLSAETINYYNILKSKYVVQNPYSQRFLR